MKDAKKLLIKAAKVIDPESEFHNKTVDLLIAGELIEKIAPEISDETAEIVKHNNLHVSPGWFDLRANFGDPGNEDKEDLDSGARAAMAGGFTAVGLSPDTDPAIDSKADIEYVYGKANEYPLHIFPFGAFTRGLKGEELSEMYDMYQAGAVGFSHGKSSVKNSSVMQLALQYARNFAPYLHVQSYDENIRHNGVMHEGAKSTWLGLKGIPSLAEELGINRDLYLAEYAETGVHFQGVSSAQSIKILERAQAENRLFSADVNMANLIFTDEDLEHYDTNLKVFPPLRTQTDRAALIEGLQSGIISAITSNHQPETIENKRCEFDLAAFGAAGIEAFFGALWQSLHSALSLEQLILLIAHQPRKILGLDVPVISANSYAELTLFDPDCHWELNKADLNSKAANYPYLNRPLKGKPLGIVNKGAAVLHHL